MKGMKERKRGKRLEIIAADKERKRGKGGDPIVPMVKIGQNIFPLYF